MGPDQSLHHFALTAGDAAAEIAFHEEVLGLTTLRSDVVTARGRSATRLAFAASPGPVGGEIQVTCLGPDGPRGRLGSNGPKSANLAVPSGSLDFWESRLFDAHVPAERATRLGTDRLELQAPSGVAYALVEDSSAADGTRDEHAVRGLYSVTVSLMDVREADAFLVDLLEARHVEQDLAWGLYEVGGGGPGSRIELLHEPYRAPGTWAYAVGTPHHIGLAFADPENRAELCERLRDAGYPDISPTTNGDGWTSAWVRTAGGTLMELVAAGA
jgi:glyoxalase family protein